jgi:hypothetical protein
VNAALRGGNAPGRLTTLAAQLDKDAASARGRGADRFHALASTLRGLAPNSAQ